MQKTTSFVKYLTRFQFPGFDLEHPQVSTEDRSAEAAQHLEKAALLTARTHQVRGGLKKTLLVNFSATDWFRELVGVPGTTPPFC